eukprot:1735728-Rhodomonas_salina.1
MATPGPIHRTTGQCCQCKSGPTRQEWRAEFLKGTVERQGYKSLLCRSGGRFKRIVVAGRWATRRVCNDEAAAVVPQEDQITSESFVLRN